MTEDEARQKWCPMARSAFNVDEKGAVKSGYPAYNRNLADGETVAPKSAFCIASDCMMWRDEGVYGDDDNNDPVHGYCGLAGKPHD